ncbi:Xaa-Pro aminopeptidase [Endozoicomonadaceae bacterium StTr2]
MIRLPREEYARRRRQLMSLISKDGMVVIPAAPEVSRNRDSEYAYRQDSHFYYLTGFNEPEAVLVLIPGREEGEQILFCRERHPEMEIWTGRRAGQAGAVCEYGMDESFSVSTCDEQMPKLMAGRHSVYACSGASKTFDEQLQQWLRSTRRFKQEAAQAPDRVISLDQILSEMRLFKSDAELDVMRHAALISSRAHMRAMMVCREGLSEYSLEAEIIHESGFRGARFQAYNPIVGSGENACTLHYNDNDAPLKDGDLVLIDAGCEVDNYASDITRTFPVNGKFSPEQKAVYEIVLDAQQQAVDAVQPGNSFNDPHEVTVKVITEGLVRLGLLEGDVDQLIEEGAYKAFYMHRTSHWIGMDVHDVGEYKINGEWREFREGMVLTVEPGIYIAPDNEQVEARWRGIGIRIEDDIAVTATGNENLTAFVPKQVDEIEQLMAS